MSVLFAVLALSLLVAACGGGSSSSSSGGGETEAAETEAGGGEEAAAGGEAEKEEEEGAAEGGGNAKLEAIVAEGLEPVLEWKGATKGPKPKSGQLVYAFPCAAVVEGCNRVADGVKEAAEQLGWTYKTGDPAGEPSKAAELITQAVNAGANAIVIVAIEPKTIEAAVAKARKAGVPVVCVACGRENDPEYFKGPGEPATETGINADVTFGGERQGKLMGAYLALESGEAAKVAMMESPEFPINISRADATKAVLGECAECEVVNETNFTTTEFNGLGAKSQSFLRSSSGAEYLWLAYDAAAAVAVPAMQQPGATEAKIVSFGGDSTTITQIAEGLQTATIGTPLVWTGWEAANEIVRIEAGEKGLMDPDVIPAKLITEENAEQFAETGYEGDIEFRAKYEELWEKGSTDTSAEPLE